MSPSTHSIAVDIGGSHFTVALVGNDGIYESHSISADPRLGLAVVLPQIAEAVANLRESTGLDGADCLGIGLAVPMLVDYQNTRVSSAAKDKYSDAPELDLVGWARETFSLPLKLEVDAHAACLGEWKYGAAKGLEDFVYVTIGTGYGTSVVMRGRPLRGRSGLAGILGGHISVNAGITAHDCVCPSRGCIEAETGTWALGAIAAEYANFACSSLATVGKLSYRTVFEHAAAGDHLAQHLRDRNVSFWAASFVNLTHAYDPEKIIAGGGIMRSADFILPKINEHLETHTWRTSEATTAVLATHPETAALLGLHSLFSETPDFL